jgi:DNA polymerase III delta prime subunit
MYLSFFEEKPFYHELDFKSRFIEKYLYSLLENQNQNYNYNDILENYNLQSIYNLQNIIIHGPNSSGKTTQIYAFLSSLLNTRSVYHLKNNDEGFRYKYSPFHIQFSVKNFKNSDIIDDNPNIKFIRNIISTPNMGFHIPKILYITDFDKTSMEIQKFFLRIIEKSASNVRFILEINDLKHLNEAIISRFYILYCKIPSYEEIKLSLHRIYDKYILHNHSNMIENHSNILNELVNEKENVLNEIILNSHLFNFTYKPTKIHYQLKDIYGNIAIYISSFQNQHMYKNIYMHMYFKKCIKLKNVILQITQNTFFEDMNYIRELLLELYVNNINLSMVLHYLYLCAIEYFDYNHTISFDLCEKLSNVEHKMKLSNKDIIFVELYIVHILKYILFIKNEIKKVEKEVKEVKEVEKEEVKEVKEVEKEVEKEEVKEVKEVEKEEVKEVKEEKEVKKRGRKKKV